MDKGDPPPYTKMAPQGIPLENLDLEAGHQQPSRASHQSAKAYLQLKNNGAAIRFPADRHTFKWQGGECECFMPNICNGCKRSSFPCIKHALNSTKCHQALQ